MEGLKKTLTFSTLLHIFILGQIFFNQNFNSQSEPYFIDFISAPSGGLSGLTALQTASASQPKKIVSEPLETIHPKEDLILKRQEKERKRVKEKVLEIPQTPSIPKLLSPARKKDVPVPTIPEAISSQLGATTALGFETAGEGGNFTGTDFQYGWYVQGMKKKLDSQWRFDSDSLSKLSAQVAFTIQKDGSVLNPEIERTSGNTLFDQAALRAVQSANPLPPLPAQFTEKELRVHVRFSHK